MIVYVRTIAFSRRGGYLCQVNNHPLKLLLRVYHYPLPPICWNQRVTGSLPAKI
jgi:hypothetical protein